jgi:hypothetical protein
MPSETSQPPVTLNVIYVEGTARPLSLGALSLLRHTSFRLRLVSNGCSPAEDAHLKSLCASEPRLEFVRLPAEARQRRGPAAGRVQHCDAIDHLQRAERSPWFGFVDSDVFAVGPVAGPVAPGRGELLSAFPPTAAWPRAHERRLRKRNAVGSSFFAVYDNAALDELRERTGVGFERYRWQSVPEDLRRLLGAAGHACPKFDTGKLLNTLLALDGATVRWLDDANLRHLGGFSHPVAPVPPPATLREWPAFVARKLRRHLRDYRRAGILREKNRVCRNACAGYFGALLAALDAGDTPPPPPDPGDRYVRDKMLRMGEDLVALHALVSGCQPRVQQLVQ